MPTTPNITTTLVESLIKAQFPQWAHLPVTEVIPNGWDNRTFRLGDEMSVRLPSAERYTSQTAKEQRWLPILAPHLPLEIPTPIAAGKPTIDYPWNWTVNGWIEGETAAPERINDLTQFASDLANFLKELQLIDATGGPPPGAHNFHRGGNLGVYDDQSREAIEILTKEKNPDIDLITEVWNTALESTWNDSPVWIRSDVSQGNLLVRNGQLVAAIDFGGMCVGDPAGDLTIAWTMFKGESRAAFRSILQLDKDTWARARGWTLWKALIIITGISSTNAIEASRAHQTITEILADHPLE